MLLQPAHAGCREIAGDAVDGGAVRAVGRQVDLDDRIVEPGIAREGGADRRVIRQVDDAVMRIRHLQLALRAHHAVRFHATDVADRQRHVDAGHIGSGQRQRADEAGPCVRRTADDLQRLAAIDVRPAIDGEHAQLVGIGMLFGIDHLGDGEGLQRRLVVDGFDLEPDHGQPLDDFIERGVGVEMVLEPGECEFHGSVLLTRSGRCTASGCRAGGSRNGPASARRRRRRRANPACRI